MTCADYERHERLLECRHPPGVTQVQVTMEDGCSGRLCLGCWTGRCPGDWPDIAEQIAGPEAGLDALQMLRALERGARS